MSDEAQNAELRSAAWALLHSVERADRGVVLAGNASALRRALMETANPPPVVEKS